MFSNLVSYTAFVLEVNITTITCIIFRGYSFTFRNIMKKSIVKFTAYEWIMVASDVWSYNILEVEDHTTSNATEVLVKNGNVLLPWFMRDNLRLSHFTLVPICQLPIWCVWREVKWWSNSFALVWVFPQTSQTSMLVSDMSYHLEWTLVYSHSTEEYLVTECMCCFI